jgi:hypothetical protein
MDQWADTVDRLALAQETTAQLLDRILDKKTEFLERFERVEARLAEIDAKVTALWFAPGMPGAVEAKYHHSQQKFNE